MDVLHFFNVFFGGLTAGGLFIVLTAYARSLKGLPAADISRIHSFFHPLTHRRMEVLTIAAALTAVVIAIVGPHWNASTILPLVGIAGAATQAILSRVRVVPMSDEIIEWTEPGHSPPADYLRFLRSWTWLHAGRTAGAVGAFTCYLLGVVLR